MNVSELLAVPCPFGEPQALPLTAKLGLVMRQRVGREVQYMTVARWAERQGFVPPGAWLCAMSPRPKRPASLTKRVYAVERVNRTKEPIVPALVGNITERDWNARRREVIASAATLLAEFWDTEAREQFGGFVPAPRIGILSQRAKRLAGSFCASYWRIYLCGWLPTKGTLLHEAAHALTPNHGHDAAFVCVLRRLYARHLQSTSSALDAALAEIAEPTP